MRVNIQSVALRLVAIGLTALLFVLGLSGIRAIAKVNIIGKPSLSPINLASFPSAAADEPGSPQASPLPNSAPQDRAFQNPWSLIPFPTASSLTAAIPAKSALISSHTPPQETASADPSNFGDRHTKDIYGKSVNNAPIVVLHETVGTASSAINTFQTPHPDEDDQVSYHSLIRQNGAIIYIVSPTKRAFGAGNSAYRGANGLESVKTHRSYPSSVNNFAYHISLESPDDGHNSALTHSGYTDDQYQSLAWLIAQTNVPVERIVTHKIVDRSGSRIDPRSFNDRKFSTLLRPYLQAMQEDQSR
jgi:hypothetical protein